MGTSVFSIPASKAVMIASYNVNREVMTITNTSSYNIYFASSQRDANTTNGTLIYPKGGMKSIPSWIDEVWVFSATAITKGVRIDEELKTLDIFENVEVEMRKSAKKFDREEKSKMSADDSLNGQFGVI